MMPGSAAHITKPERQLRRSTSLVSRSVYSWQLYAKHRAIAAAGEGAEPGPSEADAALHQHGAAHGGRAARRRDERRGGAGGDAAADHGRDDAGAALRQVPRAPPAAPPQPAGQLPAQVLARLAHGSDTRSLDPGRAHATPLSRLLLLLPCFHGAGCRDDACQFHNRRHPIKRP